MKLSDAEKKPVIAITVGDPNGIGPEITLKSVVAEEIRNVCVPVIIGPPPLLHLYQNKLNIKWPLEELADIPVSAPESNILRLWPVAFSGRNSPPEIQAKSLETSGSR